MSSLLGNNSSSFASSYSTTTNQLASLSSSTSNNNNSSSSSSTGTTASTNASSSSSSSSTSATPSNTNEASLGMIIRGRLPPTEFPTAILSCCTKLGKRKKQEDRCILIPKASPLRDDVTFLGVFDGTVGDDAAEFVNTHIAEQICCSKPFLDAITTADSNNGDYLRPNVVSNIESALATGYAHTDELLLRMCKEKSIDYSACTSVTAILAKGLLSCAHLGDSKIVLGREMPDGKLIGKCLTIDHKPDQPEERKRIEANGGSLAYLHGGKPFIRGGDFTERQMKGDRPMQLNYSRAFGGKDLKMFGLSAVPDILHIQLTKSEKLVILASDGLWDVSNADTAVKRAWESIQLGRDPALDLTDYALHQHDIKGSIDNVTVIVAYLK